MAGNRTAAPVGDLEQLINGSAGLGDDRGTIGTVCELTGDVTPSVEISAVLDLDRRTVLHINLAVVYRDSSQTDGSAGGSGKMLCADADAAVDDHTGAGIECEDTEGPGILCGIDVLKILGSSGIAGRRIIKRNEESCVGGNDIIARREREVLQRHENAVDRGGRLGSLIEVIIDLETGPARSAAIYLYPFRNKDRSYSHIFGGRETKGTSQSNDVVVLGINKTDKIITGFGGSCKSDYILRIYRVCLAAGGRGDSIGTAGYGTALSSVHDDVMGSDSDSFEVADDERGVVGVRVIGIDRRDI